MSSPREKLLRGALLGDIVEEITGRDARIVRSQPSKAHDHEGQVIHLYSSKAYSGRYLVGTARVLWKGKATAYSVMLKERMRDFLRNRHVQPNIVHIDASKGVLDRDFSYHAPDGFLNIQERIFLNKIECLLPNSSSKCLRI